MKTRFFIAIATIFVSTFAAHAATVDEIIAQFPAQDAATANALFDQLLAMDDDAIEELCTRLVPLGAGDDNAARYALTGLARYVSGPGVEAGREAVEEALLEGLEANTDAECRAFLLRQLQQCGSDEIVSEIGTLLEDEANATHAILTLDAIGTKKATRVLTKGLKKTSGATQLQILSVLANNGPNRSASKVVRDRLGANPAADEYVHLLSILVSLEGIKANDALIAAVDRPEPRCQQAALGLANELLPPYMMKCVPPILGLPGKSKVEHAREQWRTKMDAPGTTEEMKTKIGTLLHSK